MKPAWFDEYGFNEAQKAALSLMRDDLRFLYTVILNRSSLKSNYIMSALPYFGTIIDGVEDWINRYNKSTKKKLPLPIFTEEENRFYANMRNSIKLWESDYRSVYAKLKNIYEDNERYFSSICCPVAKKLRLYDIFGADIVDSEFCGNTILCYYYYPDFSFDKEKLEVEAKEFAKIGGEYIGLFGITEGYKVSNNMIFDFRNYGGFIKSPVGNVFSNKFVLFSILCQIEFILVCVEQWIKDETSTKLRCVYLLYYYLIDRIPEINKEMGTAFSMSAQYKDTRFRNAMAHYGLGVILKPNEIDNNDMMFGLTTKVLNIDYYSLKIFVLSNLEGLARQIKQYLGFL